MNIDDVKSAHAFSSNHRKSIIHDRVCGCFYCLRIFPPGEITDWIQDVKDGTAMCPYCGIDSVIGESSGFPVTEEFLREMNKCWFGVTPR